MYWWFLPPFFSLIFWTLSFLTCVYLLNFFFFCLFFWIFHSTISNMLLVNQLFASWRVGSFGLPAIGNGCFQTLSTNFYICFQILKSWKFNVFLLKFIRCKQNYVILINVCIWCARWVCLSDIWWERRGKEGHIILLDTKPDPFQYFHGIHRKIIITNKSQAKILAQKPKKWNNLSNLIFNWPILSLTSCK